MNELKIGDAVIHHGIKGKIILLTGGTFPGNDPKRYYRIQLEEPDPYGCTVIDILKSEIERNIFFSK